jgi:hypothetical protein
MLICSLQHESLQFLERKDGLECDKQRIAVHYAACHLRNLNSRSSFVGGAMVGVTHVISEAIRFTRPHAKYYLAALLRRAPCGMSWSIGSLSQARYLLRAFVRTAPAGSKLHLRIRQDTENPFTEDQWHGSRNSRLLLSH